MLNIFKNHNYTTKEVFGVKEYNKINANTEQRHRGKLMTSLGEEEYKKQQVEYMKEYRGKKKQ
jgi:hypothetical protein